MAMKKAGSRSVQRRQKAASSEAARELAVLLRQELPGIGVQEKFGNLSFSVGGKVFGFTRGEDAVALKLPAELVKELAEERGFEALVMGKRVMKEWVVVECGARGWRGELGLFREAKWFVSGER
ncbi:MmcQ/YjbR family DNA-binding protein [Edaphobacter bradus]|uniref:hypothetical protein n=1 Tax=Edaphobacter bradus TaxID=2259016 RepID=UPI0021E0D3EB|nr:hypothetical protein [Edaphobacter bradus]